MKRLMLVDDEPNVLHALQRMLRQCVFAQPLRIETFTDPLLALARAQEVEFDVAVSDYQMPGMNGVTFLQHLRLLQPHAVRLVLSASTEFDTVMRAVNDAEVFRYIPKPWQLSDLQETLVLALARRVENDQTQLQLGQMTQRELEERQLEADEPGITKVNWGPDGSVML